MNVMKPPEINTTDPGLRIKGKEAALPHGMSLNVTDKHTELQQVIKSFKITLDDEQRLRIADYCILHNVPKEYLMSQLRYTEKVQARGNLRNAKRFIIAGLERNYPTTQPTPKQPDQLETVNNSKPKEVERTDPLIHHFVTNAWQYIDKR